MAIVKAKPTSPGRRGVVRVKHDHLWKGKPYAPLVESQSSTGGRNNNGRITTRHKGGGHKHHYRVVDFKRDKDGIKGVVERIEYDPNRSAHIALVKYSDGERRYILAPRNVFAGDEVQSGSEAPIKPGNAMQLRSIPVGTQIHNVELKAGKGGQMARSAGAAVQLVAREGQYATVLLRSGEMRKVHAHCRATIGQVANTEHNLEKLGKAGAKRWRGVRPTVRGVAMNPVDHPHGGGEGRTSGGRHPVTPWGQQTKGKRTRTNKRTSKYITRSRKRK
ncbi:50S ribosomal protein L2 [Wenzhouxiangella marina]|uniref:Large ribosomal subunit protein uL2 n=1 Tax=Wenzhouxiangella marina TaxID=1579979 RepID=A0A0K0XY76_9GAMM|nr:50S ribosomal protein L2 [Wenzhouxiangella marina]AKS42649.1 50S ribosomal protein L2 [Wenzhouxiangella marina]MBB6085569.1 large subunit ribosomal protein L2 [Wenzhouxiangella marina]